MVQVVLFLDQPWIFQPQPIALMPVYADGLQTHPRLLSIEGLVIVSQCAKHTREYRLDFLVREALSHVPATEVLLLDIGRVVAIED